MKLTLFFILIICTGQTYAQARFSAESYLATPEKYLGKSVTVYVDSVDVPAINCTTDDPYRVFMIYTNGRNANMYVGGGWIYVKVPREKADSFVTRHNNPNKQAPANLSGVFSEWPSEYGSRALGNNPTQEQVWWSRCYSYSHFYLDCTK
jgi:hypothetical protein